MVGATEVGEIQAHLPGRLAKGRVACVCLRLLHNALSVI